MFDLGFAELIVIGIVALVVLGPERLPVVARVAGKYFAKARRMVNQVKEDIELESELAEIRSIEKETRDIAREVSESVTSEVNTLKSEVDSIRGDVDIFKNDSSKSPLGLPWKETSETKTKEDGASWKPDADDFGSVKTVHAKTLTRRYQEEPDIEDIVEQLERIKREIGDVSPSLTRMRRKNYAPRSRSNRVRIYR